MSFEKRLSEIQLLLTQQQLDGWLLYDFRRQNPLACQFLEIEPDTLLTRRFFYWIPNKGKPVKIVHSIETQSLANLPGAQWTYTTWQDLEHCLGRLLKHAQCIAMEYSPRNAIPYVSKVDAGTIELIREFDVEVVSSADLLQRYTSVLTETQFQSHLKACEVLSSTIDKTWDHIAKQLQLNRPIAEYDVQQFILAEFKKFDCITHDAPTCAVNTHSANPHYQPSQENPIFIKPGDFILIDLWCKQNHPDAIYGDITRVGVAAAEPTSRQQEIFDIVKKAQDSATQWIENHFGTNKSIMGWEVDQVCRQIIEEAGYGHYFLHRTGHSIGRDTHGSGANIDNFETHDRRHLLPGSCFSIEPGIYLPGEFGVRLEYDVYLHNDGRVQVTGGTQHEIMCLFPK